MSTSQTFELPPTIASPYVVFARLAAAELDAKGLAAAWLAEHCSAQLAEPLAAYIASDVVNTALRPREQLPQVPAFAVEGPRLGAEEQRRYGAATHGVLVHAQWAAVDPPLAALGSLALACAVAAAHDGVVFAMDMPRLLPVALLDAPFMAEGWSVSSFLVSPRSSSGGRHWLTTMGMQRLGLPNLELVDVPDGLEEQLAPVLMGAAERLFAATSELARERAAAGRPLSCIEERAFELPSELELTTGDLLRAFGAGADTVRTTAAGRAGRARVRMSVRPKSPGLFGRLRGLFGGGARVPERATVESLLRIGPPASFEGELDEWYHQLLGELVGLEPAVVVQPPDAEALEEARERALSEWPPVKERFARGLTRPERLYVKRGFPVAEGLEYMWIAVSELKDGQVTGTLSNDSVHDDALRAGKRVSFAEGELFDWMISSGESYEGGYTIAALSAGKA